VGIKINDDFMWLEIGGKILATARRGDSGWWAVRHWPRFFDRNQTITVLTVTELLETGHDSSDLVVMTLRPTERQASD
jgi:hypothetical protein